VFAAPWAWGNATVINVHILNKHQLIKFVGYIKQFNTQKQFQLPRLKYIRTHGIAAEAFPNGDIALTIY